ncbi:hypothetical protein BBJ28_00014840 [Nothophytophthora sp. Chile5]|nr:hypothetical protein BBJ28_00014840 [Nothophytophthora sp. Chile5]
MAITQDGIDAISRALFLPIMLMLDFGIFQYLVSVYYSRRRETRVRMLLVASFIGFASHVYFHEDPEMMQAFNDISEVCSQLTFLIQITIIGHAVRAKVKLRSITWLTYVAEVLIILDWLNMLGAAVEAAGVNFGDGMHVFSNVLESTTLTFVLFFRFFYLSLSGGFRSLLTERKLEIFFYILVATHEDVFTILAYATGLSWEYAQGVYMRSTIVTCILLNLRRKVTPSGKSRTNVTSSRKSSHMTSGAEDTKPRTRNAVVPLTPSGLAASVRNTIAKSFKSPKRMTTISVTGPAMDRLSQNLFMPAMLVLDASQFQYLLTVYYPRRRELRVRMLLVASFISFASHIYFHEDRETMQALNDISEASLQLTFLIQITIIGHAVRAKVKLRSITWLTYAAEVLIVLAWLNMLTAVVEAAGVEQPEEEHLFWNLHESFSLTFVLVFRFYYLSLSGGFRRVLAERKLEFFFYVIVATHEYPFMILNRYTDVTWEYAQGVYMRAVIVTCILLNVRQKANTSSRYSSVKASKVSKRYSTATEEALTRPSNAPAALTLTAAPTKVETLTKSRSKPARELGAATNMVKVAVTSAPNVSEVE